MRATRAPALLGVAAALLLAGCGSENSSPENPLPQDDAALCQDYSPDWLVVRDMAQEIVDGDRHWATGSEPVTFYELHLRPAVTMLSSRNVQDAELRQAVDRATDAGFYLMLDLGYDSPEAFANDAATPRAAASAFGALLDVCEART